MRPAEIVFGGLEDYGTGTVAKDHAGGAIGVVDDRGHHIRANYEDFLMSASRDELRSRLHGVNKGGTGGGDIESPDPGGAEFVLHQAGGRGEKHVWSDGADDDGIDVAGREAALGKGFFGGFDGEVAGGYALFDDVAFADAHAGEDPVVGSVDHFFEVGVGKKFGRNIGAEGADFGSDTSRCGQ